jgi:prepilin-type N-terminal cleavage/methylation domain-containing protein
MSGEFSVSENKPSIRGFSLIELMVTIGVLSVILMAALPSFNEFRQRSALRGATDQIVSFWANARFESLKRNSLVKVSMGTDNANYCMGAAVTDDPADDTQCDCFETNPANADFCDVGRYPVDQAEWKRIRYLGTPDDLIGDEGVVIIDPKRGGLTIPTSAGYWELASPAGGTDYRLRVNIDLFGRAVACEPSAASAKMPQYTNRRCN